MIESGLLNAGDAMRRHIHNAQSSVRPSDHTPSQDALLRLVTFLIYRLLGAQESLVSM